MYKLISNIGYIKNTPYLQEQKETMIIPRIIRKNGKEFPKDFSSISNSKKLSFIKSCSEMLERQLIGFNSFSKKFSLYYYFKNNEYTIYKNTHKGYGYNYRYGYCDSTGSAAGFDSKKVIEKAIKELIEKNEALLLWYKGMGSFINEDIIRRKFKIYDIKEQVYVFIIKEISNLNTCITFLINDNNKLISSGVSSDFSEYSSIKNSLNEARLLKNIYKNTIYSPLVYLTTKEHNDIYTYIEYLKINALKKNYVSNKNITQEIYSDYLNSSVLTLLNNQRNSKVVKILSKDLLNCLPKKNNILKNKNKKIINDYDILDNIECIPDCIIL